jgi:hypothetical protein
MFLYNKSKFKQIFKLYKIWSGKQFFEFYNFDFFINFSDKNKIHIKELGKHGPLDIL